MFALFFRKVFGSSSFIFRTTQNFLYWNYFPVVMSTVKKGTQPTVSLEERASKMRHRLSMAQYGIFCVLLKDDFYVGNENKVAESPNKSPLIFIEPNLHTVTGMYHDEHQVGDAGFELETLCGYDTGNQHLPGHNSVVVPYEAIKKYKRLSALPQDIF